MEILSSRFLIHPRDLERSLAFYHDVIGLHIMREFGTGPSRGVVFFLGGGYLEITGGSADPASDATELWLQVRDAAEVEATLKDAGVPIAESTTKKAWGLIELRAHDPDGLTLSLIHI